MTDRSKTGGASVPPVDADTYARVRAACDGAARGIDVDEHAMQIAEVVTVARERADSGFTGLDDEFFGRPVQASKRP